MTGRFMTFNLRCGNAKDGPDHWEHRRGLLVDTIRAADPDVLAVQECIPEQADWLRDAFPGFEFHGTPRGGERAGKEMCGLMWRRDRFTAQQTGTFWLSETPDIEGSMGWDAAFPRVVTWARLRDKDHTEITVANAHLDHQGELARVNSCDLIRRELPADRLLLMGDFNAEPESAAYQALTQNREALPGWVDVHRELIKTEDGQGTFHGFKGGRDGKRIDWVLISPDLRPLSCQIDRTARDGRFPSDHYPVTVEIAL